MLETKSIIPLWIHPCLFVHDYHACTVSLLYSFFFSLFPFPFSLFPFPFSLFPFPLSLFPFPLFNPFFSPRKTARCKGREVHGMQHPRQENNNDIIIAGRATACQRACFFLTIQHLDNHFHLTLTLPPYYPFLNSIKT
jgi:hypothetical protein